MTGTCTMHDTCKHRQCAECEDALPPVKTVTHPTQEQAQKLKKREEFEAWWRTRNFPYGANKKVPFAAWQAARAIDAQRIAELEKKLLEQQALTNYWSQGHSLPNQGAEELGKLLARIAELEAQVAAQAIPEGWQLVPKEPTMEMLEEIQLVEHFTYPALLSRYKAMLAASPKK